MPTLTLNIKYKKNIRQLFSANEIRERYLFGLPLEKNGRPLTDDTIENFVISSTEMVENYLSIKLFKEIITEGKDFVGDDWVTWGYMKATYPVVCALGLTGFLGTVKQVNYPKEWLSARRTSDGKLYSRLLYLVPNTNSTHSEAIIFSGIMPNIRTYGSQRQIPNYWEMKYITGFDKVPSDIMNVIGKYTALNILALAGDFLQKYPGQSSTSISLDGLSQSVSTFANGQTGIFGARIKQYSEEIDKELSRLKDYYGISWGVC